MAEQRSLLIVGASTYAHVAYEIACDMGCYHRIDFVDDAKAVAPNGVPVVGTLADVPTLQTYTDVIVAIGNPDVRLALLHTLRTTARLRIATLISPRAYVAPSAQIGEGVIVEPMAVVHTKVKLAEGCFVSAGAVINHEGICSEGVHVDCNATVAGYVTVPPKTKIASGEVFHG